MGRPLPEFSIVMPTMNQARFIGVAIDSVLSQEGVAGVELIVVDGGSHDGTPSILERYGDAIRWTSEPDRGQAHALNKGIALARGRYIGWLNSDDLLRPGALRAVAAAFAEDASRRWVIGRCSIIDESGDRIRGWITWYKNLLLRSWSYRRLILENFVSQPAVFLERSLLGEAGPFDESRRFDMDYEMWLRIGHDHEPLLVRRELASFRVYESSVTSSDFVASLRSANELSRRYAARIGKPWLGSVNYWLYYRRTALIYATMRWVRRRFKPNSVMDDH